MDLRTLLHAVRLHKAVFALAVAVGIAAGVGYALVRPPLLASKQLVIVSGGKIKTQAIIASGDPVLTMTKNRLGGSVSLETLRRTVQVTSVAPQVLQVTAEAKTADQAQDVAHAVALSYEAYLRGHPLGRVHAVADVMGGATPPAGSTIRTKAIENGGEGGALGALLGIIIAVAMSRSDRKLRERDAIAGAVGIPVLASIPVVHPHDTAGWVRLLEEYEPAVVHAWNLRTVLRQVGVSDVRHGSGSGVSVTVVSLASDRRALAVGPQLAVFAASLGIPTVLSVGTQQDKNATATLSAACTTAAAALADHPGGLQFAVGDYKDPGRESGAALTVAVAVLDGKDPQLPPMMRTTTTLLAVTSGAASAEQLARVAVSITSEGRDIAGIMVADPDSTDRTTGRLPQLAELPRRGPAQHRQQGRQRPSSRSGPSGRTDLGT